MVSGYSVSSGGDKPTESISLNFTKIEYQYIPMGQKNDGKSPMKTGWDISLGKVAAA